MQELDLYGFDGFVMKFLQQRETRIVYPPFENPIGLVFTGPDRQGCGSARVRGSRTEFGTNHARFADSNTTVYNFPVISRRPITINEKNFHKFQMCHPKTHYWEMMYPNPMLIDWVPLRNGLGDYLPDQGIDVPNTLLQLIDLLEWANPYSKYVPEYVDEGDKAKFSFLACFIPDCTLYELGDVKGESAMAAPDEIAHYHEWLSATHMRLGSIPPDSLNSISDFKVHFVIANWFFEFCVLDFKTPLNWKIGDRLSKVKSSPLWGSIKADSDPTVIELIEAHHAKVLNPKAKR